MLKFVLSDFLVEAGTKKKTVLVNNYAMYTSWPITYDETVDYSSTSEWSLRM